MRDEGGGIFEIIVLFGSYLSFQVRASRKTGQKLSSVGLGPTKVILGPPRGEVNVKLR
jgi:hypothetical protein